MTRASAETVFSIYLHNYLDLSISEQTINQEGWVLSKFLPSGWNSDITCLSTTLFIMKYIGVPKNTIKYWFIKEHTCIQQVKFVFISNRLFTRLENLVSPWMGFWRLNLCIICRFKNWLIAVMWCSVCLFVYSKKSILCRLSQVRDCFVETNLLL